MPARIPGYTVAGKTGTARKLDPDGKYSSSRYTASFIGFVPARSPKFTILVILDEPKGQNYYGSQVAAPLFSGLGRRLLALKGVAPDAPAPPLTAAVPAPAPRVPAGPRREEALNLSELLKTLHPVSVAGAAEIPVVGLEHDSRRLRAGEVFFAQPGTRTDGNRHIQEAAKLGAAAVVSELKAPPPPISFPATWVQVPDVVDAMGKMADRFFGEPTRSMTVFGVTGTNGKTTVTYFLESIAAAAGGRPAVVGTVNYRYLGRNGARREAPSVNTTPASLDLIRWLAACRDAGCTHAALEISSHALALRRADEVEFDAAVFTNIRRDHLDFHKTPEDYLRAKARLFELLSRTSSSKAARVINRDDPAHAAFGGNAPVAAPPSASAGPGGVDAGQISPLKPT